MAAILTGFEPPFKSLDEVVEVLWGEGTRLWRRSFGPRSENETSDSVPVSWQPNREVKGSNRGENEKKRKKQNEKLSKLCVLCKKAKIINY